MVQLLCSICSTCGSCVTFRPALPASPTTRPSYPALLPRTFLLPTLQRSWVGAMKKQRDELLEFIRRLAEDDKEGMMANKVLDMLWTLAKRDDCPPDTLDHALNAHLKILDFSCAQV